MAMHRTRTPRPTEGEWVLVVEDETSIRRLVRRLLEGRGYRVLLAADPLEAIAILEHTPQPLDIMLSDMIMPHMSGLELAGRAAGIRPELPIVYMSGYTQDVIGAEVMRRVGPLILPKPFSVDALVDHVRAGLRRAVTPDQAPQVSSKAT